ncbi:MAG TPA: OstA-like protein, partial [Bacteroidota bacterium]|nr:OstA-like protein [Bacteroidota bacterium]
MTRRQRTWGARIFFFLIAVGAIPAGSRAQESDSLVHVQHADSLVGSVLNGENVRELIGHVKITHGTTTVTCAKAVQFLRENKVSLEGEVTVTDDSMTMLAQHGMYYATDRTAEGLDG